MMRILILGGTGEASALVRALLAPGSPASARPLAITLSLAGRTSQPKPEAVPTRTGGFGGAEGLADWIGRDGTDLVIDATHPFAARIGANAARACAATGTRLLAIRRPAWAHQAGDRWIDAPDMPSAVHALGAPPRRVFLTIGRQEVGAFAAAPQHAYTVRAIEAFDLAVPHVTAIRARGPFDAAAEEAFLAERRIEVLVAKNSGGSATYGKIAAARALGLPVVMVARPDKPDVPSVPDVPAALGWIARL